MNGSPNSDYLAAEVMTATPQKLQLMLIDAAIRSAERARQCWHAGDDARAAESLDRAQRAVGEILAGIHGPQAPDLAPKVAGVYLFLFRTLTEANFRRDEQKLDDALRVLRVERETWQQLCRRLDGTSPSASRAGHAPLETRPELHGEAGLSLEA